MFIERTIRMLKKFGQRPGVRKTFRFQVVHHNYKRFRKYVISNLVKAIS